MTEPQTPQEPSVTVTSYTAKYPIYMESPTVSATLVLPQKQKPKRPFYAGLKRYRTRKLY